jgi:solute carrier family 25 (mitochondrial adenine nucleotide translocator), member 4/5/6/31
MTTPRTCSAFVSHTITAPAQRIQTLLETQNELVRQGRMSHPYRGVIQCFTFTKQHEGLLAFWRGNTIVIPKRLFSLTFNLTLYHHIKGLFKSDPKKDGFNLYLAKNLLSGAATGAATLSITYPLDVAYCKRQADVLAGETTRQFRGTIDIWKRIIANNGVFGLYKGFVLSVSGIVVYRAIYFGTYDSARSVVPTNNFYAKFAIAQGVTTLASLSAYPLSLIRKRQIVTTGGGLTYSSSWSAAKEIFAKEGIRGFYRGALFKVLFTQANVLTLVAYDMWKSSRSG